MARTKKEDNTKNLLKELNIKKEDLIEEIKGDIKENLDEEISNKIDLESKKTLEKMEKRIYKYKNKSILKRNILILIFLIIIGYETKILYDNNLLFNLNKKEEVETKEKVSGTKEEIEEQKDSEWYIENYSYLLDNVETNLIDKDKYYLYEEDYDIDSIKNNVRLNMAYQILEEIKKEDSVIEVKEQDLKDSYEKIFGNLDTYKAENFSDNCIQFIYNKESKKYMAIDTTCEESEEKIFRSIKEIYEEDDKLIIEVFVGLINEEKNILSTVDGKKDYDYSEDNIKKLPVYEFIFKKIDDNYYLNKIEKSE